MKRMNFNNRIRTYFIICPDCNRKMFLTKKQYIREEDALCAHCGYELTAFSDVVPQTKLEREQELQMIEDFLKQREGECHEKTGDTGER